MATAFEAALARTACALCSITDLVRVENLDPDLCSFEIKPPSALAKGKKFIDHGVQDHQMPFFKENLATCCPESSVAVQVRQWSDLPASLEIRKVVDMLEALLLGVTGWDGKCMSERCVKLCGQRSASGGNS